MEKAQKQALYDDVLVQVRGVLANEVNLMARMATVASILKNAFAYYYWCGFYVVDPLNDQELVVGPYQGTLGCLRIPFGKGVCGTVAASRVSAVVADVLKIANHIACDPRSRSEIVVPVFDRTGQLMAVIDVDSDVPDAFDSLDLQYLEAIAQLVP